MPLRQFKCTDFRCLESVELTFSDGNNLICGPNAAGKTSILEAIAYLGRGRSFRGAAIGELLRHGAREFVLTGFVAENDRETRLGVGNGPGGLEIRVAGERGGTAAELAEALPLQIIDPEVHDLVAGGPEGRRRYLDWVVFHVEPGFLDTWRRYRRALRQRNAALKESGGGKLLAGWNEELAALGELVDASRRQALELLKPGIGEVGQAILQYPVSVEYLRGWKQDGPLFEALERGQERDRLLGSTQAGPHRGDLRLVVDDYPARKLVSRGQQKLLACALVIAAVETVQTHLERPILLLLDDPAAELDDAAQSRLMAAVAGLGSQVIATSLAEDRHLFNAPPTLFHVERGVVRAAS